VVVLLHLHEHLLHVDLLVLPQLRELLFPLQVLLLEHVHTHLELLLHHFLDLVLLLLSGLEDGLGPDLALCLLLAGPLLGLVPPVHLGLDPVDLHAGGHLEAVLEGVVVVLVKLTVRHAREGLAAAPRRVEGRGAGHECLLQVVLELRLLLVVVQVAGHLVKDATRLHGHGRDDGLAVDHALVVHGLAPRQQGRLAALGVGVGAFELPLLLLGVGELRGRVGLRLVRRVEALLTHLHVLEQGDHLLVLSRYLACLGGLGLDEHVLDGPQLELSFLFIVLESQLNPLLGEPVLLELTQVSLQDVVGVDGQQPANGKGLFGQDLGGIGFEGLGRGGLRAGLEDELD